MKGHEVARLEARRSVVDEELEAITAERRQLEELTAMLERRGARLEEQWRTKLQQRDALDERLWAAISTCVDASRPSPPDVSRQTALVADPFADDWRPGDAGPVVPCIVPVSRTRPMFATVPDFGV